ncbi:SMC family ATPase [Paenibacillus sambharensis]|uniref:Nuclease SbcCD subunit C n=1 Tax=Paenibacillus sambharensis TaxID=1803190 RepID=A0A2W1LFV3_9BACL|nr:SMC family ATPase [Paenibacillus sambharensis]PZD93945.1 SMC family ATPase [Paenibacillus sambharensis]
MKPIKLTLSGLQSYREQQEIDFARLCEAGVFGIFGPTGSGKSSILDAMTLALYGKVERAYGGTQGIMNQAEKTLAVSFTFELSGAGGSSRYRVERQFKRGGDVSVNNTVCRFVEMTPGGDAVLADKLSDVNRCVEQHIGLTMQDFTRAVVLPQGKFSEFLSLTGKERRQMLQRLFSLERYGDGLAARLSQRAKAAESALGETAAEQQGLGDASEEALAEAAALKAAASEAAASARSELAQAESDHAELREIRERQLELAGRKQEIRLLEADASRMNELEIRVKLFEQAERLQPAVEDLDLAEQDCADMERRNEAALRLHAERQQAAESAAAIWKAVRQEAEEAEPLLAQRREQLSQAQRLERETEELRKQVEGNRSRFAEAEKSMQDFAEQAAKARDIVNRAQERQQELREILKKLDLSEQERSRWVSMTRRLQQLEYQNGLLKEAGQELAAADRAFNESAAACEAGKRKWEASSAALAGLLAELQPRYEELERLEEAARKPSHQLPGLLQRAREYEKELVRRQLAVKLAEELQDGLACPVCGSTEHPGVPHAGQDAGTVRELEETGVQITEGERLTTAASSLMLRLSSLGGTARQTLERIRRAAADSVSRDPAKSLATAAAIPDAYRFQAIPAAEAAAALENDWSSEPDGEELAAFRASQLAVLAAAIEAAEAAAAGLEQSWQAASTEAEQLIERSAAAEKQYTSAQADRDAKSAARTAVQERHSRVAEGCRQLLAEWEGDFQEVKPEAAGAWIAECERRDKEARSAREGLERSVAFIEEKRALLQASEQGLQNARLASVEAAARLEGGERLLQEQTARLYEWTAGQPASLLLEQTEQERAGLQDRVRSSGEAHDAAAAALQEAAELRSSAAEALKSAASRRQSAAQRLKDQMAKTGFADLAEVRELLPSIPMKEKLAAELEAYKEKARELKVQIALLTDKLDGRSVDEEHWQAAEGKLAAARIVCEAAIQQEAKAERGVEELARKHERWKALENKRLELTELSGRLSRLQSVFRGNAFVEYVAEEQLVQVCRAASERLGFLTKRRYALEVDSGGGFVIRDDANGGIRRPVGTLSGGETFLASLALALALSAQIQLRGRYPLQFFFLDEGFGTLDPELLETVISALEKLHTDKLSVGVISHVPELRARLPRRLIVSAADPAGAGSRVRLETL